MTFQMSRRTAIALTAAATVTTASAPVHARRQKPRFTLMIDEHAPNRKVAEIFAGASVQSGFDVAVSARPTANRAVVTISTAPDALGAANILDLPPEPLLIWVQADADFTTPADLVSAHAQPRIAMGEAERAEWGVIAPLFGRTPLMDVSATPGMDLVQGRADCAVAPLNRFYGQWIAGRIRPIAVCAEQPLRHAPDVMALGAEYRASARTRITANDPSLARELRAIVMRDPRFQEHLAMLRETSMPV